jgi:hypothetical protein
MDDDIKQLLQSIKGDIASLDARIDELVGWQRHVQETARKTSESLAERLEEINARGAERLARLQQPREDSA